MGFLRPNQIKSILWLSIVSSWIAGIVVGRLLGTSGIILSLSRAVRVPDPSFFGIWWEVIVYFGLTTVSFFVLSHILFGVGAVIFLFARGMYDLSLIVRIESIIEGWSAADIPTSEMMSVLFIILILAANLPLCLWSSHLGIQSSVYALNRLREKPVLPEFGSEPLSQLLLIISASLILGLVASLVFSYI